MKVVFEPTIDGRELAARIANEVVTGTLMGKKIRHVILTDEEFEALPHANRAWAANKQRIFVYGENRVPIQIQH